MTACGWTSAAPTTVRARRICSTNSLMVSSTAVQTIIVNYGMGNLRSIQHKLEKIGFSCTISSDARDVARAQLLILPGVGHFGAAMSLLRQQGLIPVLND